MAITNAWDSSTPGPNDFVLVGDDEIRDTKAALTERLNNNANIYWPDPDAGPSAHSGKQACGVGDRANVWDVWELDVDSIPSTDKAMEIDQSAATVTFGDGTANDRPYTLRGEQADFIKSTLHNIEDTFTAGSVTVATTTYTSVDSDSITTGADVSMPLLLIWSGQVQNQTADDPFDVRFVDNTGGTGSPANIQEYNAHQVGFNSVTVYAPYTWMAFFPTREANTTYTIAFEAKKTSSGAVNNTVFRNRTFLLMELR